MAVEELPEYIGGECCTFEAARTLVTWIRESPTLEERQERLDHVEALGQLVGDTYILPKLWECALQGLEPGATEAPVYIAFDGLEEGVTLTAEEEAFIEEEIEEVRKESRRRQQKLGAMTPAQFTRQLGRLFGVTIEPDRGKGGHWRATTVEGSPTVIESDKSKEMSSMRVKKKLKRLKIDQEEFRRA